MKCEILSIAAAAVLLLSGCGGSGAQRMAEAAHVADSIVGEGGDAGVVVDAGGTGLDATFRMNNPLIKVDAVGQELFEAYASQQLKMYPAAAVTSVCRALQEANGDLRIEVVNSGVQQRKEFVLSARRVLDLQRANMSALNPAAVRDQLVELAGQMVPGGKANDGCVRVETSIGKGFLEYNVVWPDEKAFAGNDQGLLTARYMKALRDDFQSLDTSGYAYVEFMKKLGIDGVRMVYSAEGSDASIRQAFPWREIMKVD